MRATEQEARPAAVDRRPGAERRRWVKPRIVTREKLEAIAVVCNPVTQKSFGQGGPCLTSTSS